MLNKFMAKVKEFSRAYENKSNLSKMRKLIAVVEQIDNQIKFDFLDVGAKGGLIGARGNFSILHELNGLRLYGIEPDPDECEVLKKIGYDLVFDCAAGARSEKRKIYITKNPGCTSIYKPNKNITEEIIKSPNFEVVNEKETLLERIDVLFEVQEFDYIKIDVQGAAHDVILGARAKLDNAIAIVADLYFDPVYIEQPLFCKTHTLLYQNNFRLAKCGAGNAHGFVRQGDFLYLKDPACIKNKKDGLKLLLSASTYSHWSFIEFLLARSKAASLFSREEKNEIFNALDIHPKQRIFNHRYEHTEWSG